MLKISTDVQIILTSSKSTEITAYLNNVLQRHKEYVELGEKFIINTGKIRISLLTVT